MMEAELTKHSFRQSVGILWSAVTAVSILTFILWEQVPAVALSMWATLCLLVMCGGYSILFTKYQQSDNKAATARLWSDRFTYTSWAASGVWGSVGILFFIPESLQMQLVIMLFMLSSTAAAVPMLVANQAAFYGSATAIVAPVSVRMAVEGDTLHYALAATGFAFAVAIAYFYNTAHRSLKNSLKLRFDNLRLISQLQTQIENNESLVQQLVHEKEAAEQANAEKSRFLAAASHDLRQPLHAQSLLLSVLRKRMSTTENIDVLNKLEHSFAASRGLFNTLLDVSKLDAGVIKADVHTFPIQQVLDDLELEFSGQAKEKGIRLRIAKSVALVESDPLLLRRVLRNLVENAIHYTASGSVLVGCRYRDRSLRIEIRDSGPGIPIDQQDAVFSEFFQLDNPERDRDKGLGLGLSIVQRITRLLDHPVKLKSAPGAGSIFSIDIPRCYSVVKKPPAKQAVVRSSESMLIGKRILVVEDDTAVANAMWELLTEWGYDVTVAYSQAEGLSRVNEANTCPPDLIITDYRLPDGHTGIGVVREIAQILDRHLPAVIITGDTAASQLQEVQASGFAVLNKPVDPKYLSEIINRMLTPDDQ